MPTGLTQLQVVNLALQQVAAQKTVTSLTDPAQPAGIYAAVVYAPTVQILLRELDPAFARFTATLSLSAAVTPVTPWAYEYLYPSDCIRLRQVRPAAGAYNVLDPQPVRANVAFDVISAVVTQVVLTNQASALAVYTSSQTTETQWSSTFADAVVRRLANPLAMALSGRPDFAKEILATSAEMAATSYAVDEFMVARGA